MTEIDDKVAPENSYIYIEPKTDKIKRITLNDNDVDESLLGCVHMSDSEISIKDIIGFPGTNLYTDHCIHFEIFSDDSIVEFIKNSHHEGDKNIFKIPRGTQLYTSKKLYIKPLEETEVIPGINIDLIPVSITNKYNKFKCTGQLAILKRDQLGSYHSATRQYDLLSTQFKNYTEVFRKELLASTKLKFIDYCNEAGETTSDKNTPFRLVYFEWNNSQYKTYWADSSSIETLNIAQLCVTTKRIHKLYTENPDVYEFCEINGSSETKASQPSSENATVAGLSSSADTYLNPTECQYRFDRDGNKWINATLPFNKHHALFLNLWGIEICKGFCPDTKTGWIQNDRIELLSSFNWPGFKIAQESGSDNKDAFIDFKNLNPFFQELIHTIDTNQDQVVSHEELQKACKEPMLAECLSRLIVQHPSEWQADESLSKWQHLKELLNSDKAFKATMDHIRHMIWWDEVKGLPDADKIYHLNPVSFILQMAAIYDWKYNWADSELGHVIGAKESHNSYEAFNQTQGKKKSTYKSNLTSYTIKKVMALQKEHKVFAAGRFQLIPVTLKAAVKKLKIDTETKFNKKTQDYIFNEYLIKHKRKSVIQFLEGSGDVGDAMYDLAKEFASIGVEVGQKISDKVTKDKDDKVIKETRISTCGESYYNGDGYNKAHITPEEIKTALIESKNGRNVQ